LEKDIESRIQSMLEHIVGVNKAVVRVSSVLDFRQVEMTEERYDPNGQVIRSEQRTQEKSSGVNGTAGGVPGVASNVPPGEAADAGSTSSNSAQTKNDTVNYEISRTVSRIIEPTGTIKKLSAAVLVDGTYEQAKPGEKKADATPKYIARSAEDMKRIEEIVKKAMGYSAERQDQVEVVNVPFGFEAEEGGSTAEGGAVSTVWAPYVRYGIGAVLFGLVLVFVVRPLIAALTKPFPAQAPALAAAPAGPALAAGQLEASLPSGPHAQIMELARSDPQSTALVVQKWLGTSAR
jgi:flagellar M-ring protein FliF